MSVDFRFSWVDAGPSPDKLAQTTMAALSVEADGTIVTAVLDRRSGIYSKEVVVPLFSVAEWLVTNWWHIWYEVGDTSEQRPEFESRHNLAFAGDGFVLPRLSMIPVSGRMDLEWTRYKPEYARIEFVDEGQHHVERKELELQFRNLIDAVLERLRSRPETGQAAESLGRVWNAINDLDADELEFSRAAALLGVDPFDVRDHVADSITMFWEHADPSVREDALALASGDSLDSVGVWLSGAIETLAQGQKNNHWSEIRQTLPPHLGVEPWARGYQLARVIHDKIGINGGRIDFEQLGPLMIPQRQTTPPSSRIHGIVGADTPACMTAPRGATGTRFLIARALGDYLGQSVSNHGLLSSLATDRQAQSRAFAAEFLAPADFLRQRIGSEYVDTEQIDELGQEFLVSSELIRRQIQNHNVAKIVAY